MSGKKKQHRASFRWKTRRMVMLGVLVECDLVVRVACSCGAEMTRKLAMRREALVGKWVLRTARTDTEADSKRGAEKCPALMAAVRNTNDAAGEPISLEAARAVLRGEG